MNFKAFNMRVRALAVWGVAGLGFALPMPTAWTNIMLILILAGWLGSGGWHSKWQAVRQAPAAMAAFAFIALVLVGLLYGNGNYGSHYLSKYASLLIIPLVLSLQLDHREQWLAIDAFCAAMALILALSILIWLQWIPASLFKGSEAGNPIVFKLHITHGVFMALAAFLLGVRAQQFKASPAKYWPLVAIASLMLINALFMVRGRTGQLIVVILLVYLFHLRFPRYGLLIGALCAGLLGTAAYNISPAFKERADLAAEEAVRWSDTRGDTTSSIGTRLDYYVTTLSIIKEHPLIGVGTKGFPDAYEKQVEGTQLQPSNNPHNQYLLVMAQYGLIGLAALLGLYGACGRQARRQPAPFAMLATGILLAYVAGNLFNSFMLDFSERVFFAWSLGLLLSAAPTNILLHNQLRPAQSANGVPDMDKQRCNN